jgi:hypothetical protein
MKKERPVLHEFALKCMVISHQWDEIMQEAIVFVLEETTGGDTVGER